MANQTLVQHILATPGQATKLGLEATRRGNYIQIKPADYGMFHVYEMKVE